MKRILILSAVLAMGIATALAVSSLLMPKSPPVKTAMAHWRNLYKTTGGLVAGADLVVVANHMWAKPGRVVGEGEDATPFTDNTFAVTSILKGEHVGETLEVEQTGGLASNGTIFYINDGGAYEPGESYLLFLKSTGEGSYHIISHQARYRMVGETLEGVDPTDSVVARMHRMPVAAGMKEIKKRVRMME
jgi:hypothetical protein